MKLLVLGGPNLNFLGIREVGIYGLKTYTDLVHDIQEYALSYGIETLFFQSNHEGELIDYLQSHYREIDGIIINPGAWTHYSYAIYDCLKSIPVPAIEVHLSDIHQREPFRRISVIKDACIAQICGKGLHSYLEAIDRFRKDKQS
jgi:3-dehydroquinate dehydratase-2